MAIEYQELSKIALPHGGLQMLGRFHDPEGTFDETRMFFVNSDPPSEADLAGKVNEIIVDATFDANPLNSFDLGTGDEQPVVVTVVEFTRSHQDATLEEIAADVDDENPDMIWKPDKFVEAMHAYLEQEMERTYTFEEFKQFLIDEKFRGVDE